MSFSIHVIGTNFKNAPLDRVAGVQWQDPHQIDTFLSHIRECLDVEEAFFLQTCNRREFYFYAPEASENPHFFRGFLQSLSRSLGTELDADHFYHHRDHNAARHLFRVASSLDSMVIGETEIMKQIKVQAARARKYGHLGRRLMALVDLALWASKQVRGRTRITKNVTSMASLIFRKVRERKTRRLVIVGAGHYVQSIMPSFSKASDIDFLFVNRSIPTDLAEAHGGRAMTLKDFLANPEPFDAMITATGAPHHIFGKQWFERLGRSVLVLDAALPTDVAPEALQLPSLDYFDLSQMEDILAKNRAAREAEIPKAEPFFAEALERLDASWLECDLAGYSREISSHYQDAGERALAHLMKDGLPDLPDDQAEVLRAWTRSLVGKLTNIPILGLKGVARDLGTPAVDAFTRQVASKSNLFRA